MIRTPLGQWLYEPTDVYSQDPVMSGTDAEGRIYFYRKDIMAREPKNHEPEQVDYLKLLKDNRETLLEQVRERLKVARQEIAQLEADEAFLAGPTKAKAPQNRTPRGSVQNSILELLGQHPEGLEANHVIKRLNAEDDATKSASLRNALASLKKANKIGHANGVYTLP